MKKLLTIVMALALAIVACVSCGNTPNNSEGVTLEVKTNNVRVETKTDYTSEKIADDFKIGLITLHDDSSTYDKNFIDAMKEAVTSMGLSVEKNLIIKTGVPESDECAVAARELASQGCKVVFADSFGHEPFIMQVAKEYTNVQFCHATGTKAHTAGIANFHNAFASIYEGRFLAGVAAGMKLAEMKNAGKLVEKNYDANGKIKVGYVGAFTYAEVVSGYTSWFLGVKTALQEHKLDVVMDVKFTGSWYDEAAEKTTAEALIEGGCALISQHADSMGAPTACENAGVPNVSYNGSTQAACPKTFIVSSRINWAPYFQYIIAQANKGEAIAADWCGTMATDSVLLTEVNESVAAAGTQAKIDEYKAKIENGTLKIFDVSKDNYITVGGKKLTSAAADVDDMGDYVAETEAIQNGYYNESIYRSAPTFDLTIDGITLLNSKY